MGNLNTQLFCCSDDMIDDVSSGKIAVAYYVLGSYAMARRDAKDTIRIIAPQDFTTVVVRNVLILTKSQQPSIATRFVDHLIKAAWDESSSTADYPFPTISRDPSASDVSLRPIHMGPGLLFYFDKLKSIAFSPNEKTPFCSPEAAYSLNQTCYHFAHLYPDDGIFWSNNAPHPNLWPISYATETAGNMSHKPSQGSLIS